MIICRDLLFFFAFSIIKVTDMEFIKKYRGEIILTVLTVTSYFFLRLINLSSLPIFTDEAIYARWAQIALNDVNWRFISLTDGKQPMFTWFAMIFMKFIDDPLIAVRAVSVLCGFFTMVGLWFLSLELFKSRRIAYLCAILYVCYPFAQVLDRMGLQDSMVGAFTVWALYFSILLVRKPQFSFAYTLGFLIGGGILSKSTNFFSIYLLPVTLLLFDFKSKNVKQRFIKWVFLAVFAVVIAEMLYSILRLSPLFSMIGTKNATFVFPLSEWLKHPLYFLWGNANGLVDWLLTYLRLYLVLIILSWFVLHHYTKEKIVLFLYFLIPFTGLIVFGNTLYPRFIFFMSLSLLPLAAVGLDSVSRFVAEKISKKVSANKMIIGSIISIVLFASYSLFVSLQFVYDPTHAQIARSDILQYINSWPAGWGVKESIAFFEKEARDKKIFVATEGTFGLMPASLELYLGQNKNITIKGYWPLGEKLPPESIEYAKKMPSYFVFYQPEHVNIPPDYPLQLVSKVRAGESNHHYRIYRIVLDK